MILLVSRASVSPEVVAWVSHEIGIGLHVSASLEEGSRWLRGANCAVAVVDAGWLETDPSAVDHLLSENPALLPVFPNLAVCGPERLACEIKAALRRGGRERQRASDCARRELWIHLKNSLTAMLLNCDLALQIPELPDEAAKKLLLLHDLATKMRDQLEVQGGQAASA
jgi:hypothetical protein